MASLFKAISNVVRGAKDDLTKKIADPVRDGKLAIADSEKQVILRVRLLSWWRKISV
jgi:hypothetical protein